MPIQANLPLMAPGKYDFTSLILISTSEGSGAEESLREVLAPFSLEILDTQRIAMRGKLIVGILIGCDPAHVLAIEADLLEWSNKTGLDAAIDYSEDGIQ